jgi:hypothetical protein
VGADSVAEVTSAFRNYFTNVEEFLDLIEKARAKLAERGSRSGIASDTSLPDPDQAD